MYGIWYLFAYYYELLFVIFLQQVQNIVGMEMLF